MRETTVPIYLIAGFLESGKTTFLSFTLEQEYFQVDGKTLLILCEEGEEEYDRTTLAMYNTVVEVIESEEDFTTEKLYTLDMKHKPERVVIEYNGMWLVSRLREMKLPRGWGIEQHIVIADASTFQVYIQNMKSLFMDMVKGADMVVFNRSNMELPLANFRRSIKVSNPSCEVIFENEEGEIDDIFKDEMPFDVDAPVIEIPPEDYGIWFVDATDHPEKYDGKEIHFTARVRRPPAGLRRNEFVPGRTAMTCCADDTTFLGYICEYDQAPQLKNGQWIDLKARIRVEARPEYRGEEGVVLVADSIRPCAPLEDEMVYFN